jgi:hypothetical protein
VPSRPRPKLIGLDADRVGPKLWQGAYPRAVLGGMWLTPPLPPHEVGPLLRLAGVGAWVRTAMELPCDYPMDDAELTPEILKQAEAAAISVRRHLAEGRRVLVTCNAGKNRSGLVCGLVLRDHFGLSGLDALHAVRTARGPNALCNRSFAQYLCESTRRRAS